MKNFFLKLVLLIIVSSIISKSDVVVIVKNNPDTSAQSTNTDPNTSKNIDPNRGRILQDNYNSTYTNVSNIFKINENFNNTFITIPKNQPIELHVSGNPTTGYAVYLKNYNAGLLSNNS